MHETSYKDEELFQFYTFLLCSRHKVLAEILDFLGDKSIEFLRLFGGSVIEVPTELDLKEAQYFFRILCDYVNAQKSGYSSTELKKYIIVKYEMTNSEYLKFKKYYFDFSNNHKKMFSNFLKGVT